MNTSSRNLPGRLAIILLLVVGIDALLVGLLPHPRPWVVLASFLLPMLNSIFVIGPVIRQSAIEHAD